MATALKFIELTQAEYDGLIPNQYTFYKCTDTNNGYLGSKEITNDNIENISNIIMYFCLWNSGINPPPSNEEMTAAICGTAICGLTICGLSDTNDFWSTKECYSIDSLYKWMKYTIEYSDGTIEEMGPYCFTDYYTREIANEALQIANNNDEYIQSLNVSDEVISGQYVSAVNQINGIIDIVREDFPEFNTTLEWEDI